MALSKIDVANMLTGTAPVANGGTGVTTSAGLANTSNLVFIKKITLTSDTNPIQFLNSDADVTFDTTYDTYRFFGTLAYENDSRVTYIRVSNDGTNLDTGTVYLFDKISVGGGSVSGTNDASSSVWQLEDESSGNDTGEHLNFELTILNSSFGYCKMLAAVESVRTNNTACLTFRGARYQNASRIQGISFFPNSSNNFKTGSTISMYGVKS